MTERIRMSTDDKDPKYRLRLEDDGLLFEASGGVNLDTIREIAATGVHLISVGALTHSAPALDTSLEIEAS